MKQFRAGIHRYQGKVNLVIVKNKKGIEQSFTFTQVSKNGI